MTAGTDPAVGGLREQALNAARDGRQWVTRRVASKGIISVGWQAFSVGKHYGGSIVDVHAGEQLLQVWHGRELIKTVPRTTKGDIREKRASVAR